MKRTLRVTLLTVLLVLVTISVAVVGYSGYNNARRTAYDLSDEVVEQATARVAREVDIIENTADRQTTIVRHMLANGLLSPDRPGQLVGQWVEIIAALPILSGMSLTREDGHALVIEQVVPGDPVLVREYTPKPGGKQWQVQTFTPDGFREGGRPLQTKVRDFDPRQRTDYRLAVQAPRPEEADWTPTHLDPKEGGYPAISRVSVVRDRDGRRVGVLGITFNTLVVCEFLGGMDVGDHGSAFILEQGADGRRLVAHAEPGHLAHGPHTVEEGGAVHDPLVVAFVAKMGTAYETDSHRGVKLFQFRHDGLKYMGAYRKMQDRPNGTGWTLCVVLPESDVLGKTQRHLETAAWVAVGVLALAALLSIRLSAAVARPLERLAAETQAVGRLELAPSTAPPSHIVEVGHLQHAVEDMKASLRSFRKYVPADLVSELIRSGQEAILGGDRRRLTVFFSDIVNFTTVSESMEPEALVEHLGEYLAVMSGEVLETGGTVDKYIGDAIMAFWGAPAERADHALAACATALKSQRALEGLRAKWRGGGRPEFHARIGINTGEVLVGNIGSAARMNYTVIGDVVNLASRLEGLNKYYGTRILISEFTLAEVRDVVVARPLDWVSVKGRAAGVLVYELLGMSGECDPEMADLVGLFGKALADYRRQEWSGAAAGFEAVLARWPGDGPSAEMLRRCRAYTESPPGETWDGVHRMTDK